MWAFNLSISTLVVWQGMYLLFNLSISTLVVWQGMYLLSMFFTPTHPPVLYRLDMYSTGFWKGGYIPWVPQRGLRGQSPSGESFQKLNFQKARIIMLHWVQDCTNALRNEAKRITSVCLKDVYKGMRFTRIQYIDVICKWLVFMTLMIFIYLFIYLFICGFPKGWCIASTYQGGLPACTYVLIQ